VGPPVEDTYTNFDNQSVRGFAIEPGTLGPLDNAKSYAYRVSGRHTRYIFPFFFAEDRTDDTLLFGPQPRPTIGGAFAEDGSLASILRSTTQSFLRGQSVWRRVRNDIPIDSDEEANWRQDDESFGKAR
jgi:hypothetical protein